MHAVDRLARGHEPVQGLQHQAVAAERDHDVGLFGRRIAVALHEPRAGVLRLGDRACDEERSAGGGIVHSWVQIGRFASRVLSFLVRSEFGSSFLFEHDLFRKPVPTPDHVRGRLFRDHALARREDAHERARGVRLYDLSLPCRGGADRQGGAGEAARGLREHPAGHDLALLVAGRDRARRGGRDDHQDPRLARRGRAGGREGAALLRHAGHPGAADRGRGGGVSGVADEAETGGGRRVA